MKRSILLFSFACLLALPLQGGPAGTARAAGFQVPGSPFDPARVPAAPTYSAAENWAVVPAKAGEKAVDVVFFHPTSYFGDTHWNQAMPEERKDRLALEDIKKQAGVFAARCNIYAPFYRQASIHVLGAREADENAALGVAYEDIERAFDHYLETFNQGRPFILAGHSQGSNLLLRLLEKRFDDPALAEQLVAAYVIGWSVTRNDLKAHPHIRMCDSFDATGCVVSYNTQEADPEMSVVREGAIVVNPLLWDTSERAAGKELNRGAVFYLDGAWKEIPNYTGAQTAHGALIVPTPPNVDELKTPRGFYHSYDYSFFYRNLEQNVSDRIAAYQRAH